MWQSVLSPYTNDDQAYALYFHQANRTLYCGGQFLTWPTYNVVAYNVSSSETKPLAPGLSGFVRAFAYNERTDQLYVGGEFLGRLAVFDPTPTVPPTPVPPSLDVVSSSSTTTGTIIAAVLVPLLLVIVIAIVIVLIVLRRRQRTNRTPDDQHLQTLSQTNATQQTNAVVSVSEVAALSAHVIPASELVLGLEIGRGSGGVVYKAMWRGSEVAVKQILTSNDMSEKEIRGFIGEISMMVSLRPHGRSVVVVVVVSIIILLLIFSLSYFRQCCVVDGCLRPSFELCD
jgi:hypothetical protein